MKVLSLFSTLLAVAAAAPLAEEAVQQDVQDVAEAQNVSAETPAVDMTANGVKILPRFDATS
jgi:hypothetical protein